MLPTQPLVDLAEELVTRCRGAGLTLGTAESCTGGLIASTLTSVSGCSDVFERGLITYSNAAKTDLLGVPANLLEEVGAVSEPVALAMAQGMIGRAPVDLAVAVTGIAGPGGGSAAKPVGLVHIAAVSHRTPPRHRRDVFAGGRSGIRIAATAAALRLVFDLVVDAGPRG